MRVIRTGQHVSPYESRLIEPPNERLDPETLSALLLNGNGAIDGGAGCRAEERAA
jgi:hypothetical protein